MCLMRVLLCNIHMQISDATSPAHRVLMGVNANPLASARMEVHVIQCMGNAIALVDGRYVKDKKHLVYM